MRLASQLLDLRRVDTARGVYHTRDARGHRYYIKYRSVQPHEVAPFFMFVPGLHNGFDHLVGLIFARDTFDLLGLFRTPHDAVWELVRHNQNADLLTWKHIREDPRVEKFCLCTDDRLGRQYKLRWSPRR